MRKTLLTLLVSCFVLGGCAGSESIMSTTAAPATTTYAAVEETETEAASTQTEETSTSQEENDASEFEKLFRNGPIPAQAENQLWGFIDSSGQWIISPAFIEAKAFWYSGLALVRDTQTLLWGMIDSSGDYAIEPTFDQIGEWFNGKLFRVHVPNRGWGYIDKTGAFVIAPQFDMAYDFSEGLACVGQGNFDPYNPDPYAVYGYIDESGEFVIPPKYSVATSFSSGVAFVDIWDMGNHYCTLIGKDGSFITDSVFGYSSISNNIGSRKTFNDGLCPVQTKDETGYVYINPDGEVILPKTGTPYEYATSFSLYNNGYAAVGENNLIGYINTDGEWIIPPRYISWSPFMRCGLAYGEEPGFRGGFIDSSGNYILELDTNLYSVVNGNGNTIERISVYELSSRKVGFWNLEGDIIINYIFDGTYGFAEDCSYAKVLYCGLWGIIDKDGNWLIPAQFLSIGR